MENINNIKDFVVFVKSLNYHQTYKIDEFLKTRKTKRKYLTEEELYFLLKYYKEEQENGIFDNQSVALYFILTSFKDAILFHANNISGCKKDDEMFSYGYEGLIRAAKTFDDSKQNSASPNTYLQNGIYLSLRNWTFTTNKKMAKDNKRIVSMQDTSYVSKDGDELKIEDTLFSQDDQIYFEKFENEDYVKFLKSKLIYLEPLERFSIILYSGYTDFEPMNQNEISTILNLSQGYVSRIIRSASNKLKLLLSTNSKDIEKTKLFCENFDNNHLIRFEREKLNALINLRHFDKESQLLLNNYYNFTSKFSFFDESILNNIDTTDLTNLSELTTLNLEQKEKLKSLIKSIKIIESDDESLSEDELELKLSTLTQYYPLEIFKEKTKLEQDTTENLNMLILSNLRHFIPKKQFILISFYGLYGNKPLTLEAIAQKLDISVNSVEKYINYSEKIISLIRKPKNLLSSKELSKINEFISRDYEIITIEDYDSNSFLNKKDTDKSERKSIKLLERKATRASNVLQCLNHFNQYKQYILISYFGLYGNFPKTAPDIANTLKLPSSSVRTFLFRAQKTISLLTKPNPSISKNTKEKLDKFLSDNYEVITKELFFSGFVPNAKFDRRIKEVKHQTENQNGEITNEIISISDLLLNNLSHFNQKHQYILISYFGLYNNASKTGSEIGRNIKLQVGSIQNFLHSARYYMSLITKPTDSLSQEEQELLERFLSRNYEIITKEIFDSGFIPQINAKNKVKPAKFQNKEQTIIDENDSESIEKEME